MSLVSDAELVRVDPQLAQGLAQLLDVELDHLNGDITRGIIHLPFPVSKLDNPLPQS